MTNPERSARSPSVWVSALMLLPGLLEINRIGQGPRRLVLDDPQRVSRMVAGARDVWQHNVFPAMKVTWGTYPNDLGHVDAPGCFRCHDDGHKTKAGKTIGQTCDLCHDIK